MDEYKRHDILYKIIRAVGTPFVRCMFNYSYEKLKDVEGKLADEISAKVLENLEPRFAEIEKKLSNDNTRIGEHTRELDEHRKRMDSMETGQRAICRGVLALLSHEINGNSTDKLKEAQTGISNYLIDK